MTKRSEETMKKGEKMTPREIARALTSGRHGLANARGMTLVEVLIVLTIMASIMGVVGVFVVGAIDRANVKEAQIEIKNLEGLCNSYMLSSTPRALPESLEDLTKGPAPLTKKVPKDPWGNDYLYNKVSNMEFTISSAGADGKEGTEDDVGGAE